MEKQELQAILHRLTDVIVDYLEADKNPDTKVVTQRSREELLQLFSTELPEKGQSYDALFADIEQYLELSVRTAHPRFFNQLWGGFSLPGFLGDVIASLSRTSMYTFEMAPVATLMELELMRKMTGLVGWPNGEGTFVTGGSNGNMLALLMGRNRRFPNAKQQGTQQLERPLSLFISEQAHYSFEKACNILGLGTDALVHVASDNKGRIRPDALQKAIDDSKAAGREPFFVCATAGTTVLGAYDPIHEIAPITKANNLWLHIDGSWGGSALVSPRYRHLMQGAEEADSMVWNPHKQMSVSLPCSVLLAREPGQLMTTCASGNNSYLFREYEHANLDLGEMSLQCGRKVDALKLWLSWKYYGDDGYAQRIDRLFELAAYAEKLITAHPRFELQAERQSTNVCFRYIPQGAEHLDLNTFNEAMRTRFLEDGRAMINVAYINNGEYTIRWVFANPETTEEDLEISLKLLEEAAEKTRKEFSPQTA